MEALGLLWRIVSTNVDLHQMGVLFYNEDAPNTYIWEMFRGKIMSGSLQSRKHYLYTYLPHENNSWWEGLIPDIIVGLPDGEHIYMFEIS